MARSRKRGELVVLYFNFVRYSKIEEIYGWEKLDAVLETTAKAVREFLDDSALRSSRMMVGFTNDDDFIFFHVPAAGVPAASERRDHGAREPARASRRPAARGGARRGDRRAVRHLRRVLARVLQSQDPARAADLSRHSRGGERGEERRAARARAQGRRPQGDACATRSVYIDYHPIVTTDTGEVFGYEALARGVMRSLRSPEVMFEVAAEADLIWELVASVPKPRGRGDGVVARRPSSSCFSTSIRTTFRIPTFDSLDVGRAGARRHRDHRAHRDQGLSEVPRAAAGVPRSRASGSRSTTPAAATRGSDRSRTSSPTSSSSTSR